VVTGAADTSVLVVTVDGSRPLSAASVADLGAMCDAAEDDDARAFVIVHLSGVPGADWAEGLSVTLVSKWERGLRRLERLPATTIAVVEGDCGGAAFDALLATDYRIMPSSAKLFVPVVDGSTWPGMALYRLARQAAGAGPARQAVLFGTAIDAATAQSIGVIDEVTGNATVAIERAMKMAATAQGAELAIRRQLMQEAPAANYEDALGVHLAACDRALRRRT
jgi:isomerase DpgB